MDAKTPYCWPPNNTRVCVPLSYRVNVLWSKSYYRSDNSRLAISFDPTRLVSETQENNGTYYLNVTADIFTNDAVSIPGSKNEKALSIWLLERSRYHESDETKGTLHRGPTLVLVPTEKWPANSTDAITRPLGSGPPAYAVAPEENRDEGRLQLSAGAIFGIVFGGLIALAAILYVCWRYHRAKKVRS